MSYIDQTYGSALEQALRGLTSRPALGQPWFGFHASEVPAGVLLYTASTHSRVLYADFWQHVQNKGLVKTEAEWQSIYLSQGWCPFYSDGDGIDTFRMPSAPLYLHGAGALSEAGEYVAEGLPNLTGDSDTVGFSSRRLSPSGVFTGSPEWDAGAGTLTILHGPPSDPSEGGAHVVHFNASYSSPIYGNSDHVTPATSKLLFGVWAIAVPQTPIPDAIAEGILSSLELKANTDLSNLSPTGRNLGAGLGMPSGRYINLELGAAGSWYTAPANGYVQLSANQATQVDLVNVTTGVRSGYGAQTEDTYRFTFIPVKKGDSFGVWYTITILDYFRFIYAEGAE